MRISRRREVGASPAAIEAILAAPAGVEAWDPAIASSAPAEPPVAIPERTVVRASDGRRRRERLVERARGERVAWQVTEGLRFPLKALRREWSLEPAGERTLVTATVDFRLHLPYGPVGAPFWLAQRRRRGRELEAALDGLATYLGAKGAKASVSDARARPAGLR